MQPEPLKKVNTTDARERMLAGVRVGYDAVSSTFGPRSANVAIDRPFGAPAVIHDGVNTFRSLFPFGDREMGVGAAIAYEAADNTNNSAGDGTTNATILIYEIAYRAHKLITAGARPMALREGIELATEQVLVELDTLMHPIMARGKKGKDGQYELSKELLMVATISAQVPDIGQMVAEVYAQLGAEAILTVEESNGNGSEVEMKTGMQFGKGWASPYFVVGENKNHEAVVENAHILVTDMHIRDVEEFHEMCQRLVNEGVKQLVVIAAGFEPMVMKYAINNLLKGKMITLLIEAPAFGEKRREVLEDIAIATGGTFVGEVTGTSLESVGATTLGKARNVTSTQDNTIIVEGKGLQKEIDKRVAQIKEQLAGGDLQAFDVEKLKERLATLDAGIGILKIGAKSEPEMKERKERAIDAISAAKAALSDGIVPGGGMALRLAAAAAQKSLADKLKDDKTDEDVRLGAKIVFDACQAPFRKLLDNAGYDAGEYVARVEFAQNALPKGDKSVLGVDVMDGQIVDMVKEGIIDPLLVIKSALGHASSAAVALATSNTVVTPIPSKEVPQNA
jgi:chaperonin GroEL